MSDQSPYEQHPAPASPPYAPPPPAQAEAWMPPPPQPVPVAPREPRRVRLWAVVLAGVLGGTVGAGAVGGVLYAFPPSAQTPPKASSGSTSSAPVQIVTKSGAQPIEAVAAKVTPSVVNIVVQQTGIDRFTGRTITQDAGEASGIIIRADGHILTNYHVVQGADRILVRIGSDDVEAKVVGTDAQTDLAVIKVGHKGLQPADVGTSSSLKVGDTVVAVGSPFGLDKTVTSGIVSALHRSDLSQTTGVASYTNLIQTDAAINPGNSGGALADIRGRVVGVNTLIESPAGSVGAAQSSGVGFAIPIEFAMGIAEQLIATGKAQHPFMGVSMATVDEAVATQLGFPDARGAYVDSVVSGSPAAKAGIKQGDIITAIGDAKVTTVEDAFAAIRSHHVGDVVDVTVLRDGKPLTLKVTLGSDTGSR